MNSKLAKYMRAMVRTVTEDGRLDPDVQYTVGVRRFRNRETDQVLELPGTVRLVDSCSKGAYRRMKTGWRNAYDAPNRWIRFGMASAALRKCMKPA